MVPRDYNQRRASGVSAANKIFRLFCKNYYIYKKCTVWGAFWAGGIIDPFFFEGANEIDVIVNGVNFKKWPQIIFMFNKSMQSTSHVDKYFT